MNAKHFFLIFIVCIFTLSPLPTNATSHTGLVTCGLMGAKTLCTICDLFTLLQSIVTKANSYFALPLAALMLGYGGFLMVLSGFQGGNPALWTKGKKVLTNTLIGIVIIFGSWLAIDTLLKTIGAYQHAASSKFGPWHVIECVSPEIKLPTHMGCNDKKQCVKIDGFAQDKCSEDFNCTENAHFGCLRGMCQRINNETAPNTCTVSPDNCPPEHHICQGQSCITTTADVIDNCNPVNGDNECKTGNIGDTLLNKLKAEELKKNGVVFSSSGDCKNIHGESVSANTNLQEMLKEEPLTICNAGCKTNGRPCAQTRITADSTMMFRLVNAQESGKQFTINSITTGDHGSGSDHYTGKAVDLSAAGGTTYADLMEEFKPKLFNGVRLAQCEDDRGKVVSNCGAGTRHLHISYK